MENTKKASRSKKMLTRAVLLGLGLSTVFTGGGDWRLQMTHP